MCNQDEKYHWLRFFLHKDQLNGIGLQAAKRILTISISSQELFVSLFLLYLSPASNIIFLN